MIAGFIRTPEDRCSYCQNLYWQHGKGYYPVSQPWTSVHHSTGKILKNCLVERGGEHWHYTRARYVDPEEIENCKDFIPKRGWGASREGYYMRIADKAALLKQGKYSEEDLERAARQVNEIGSFIKEGGFIEGCRNNTVVDLACACHVLGLDCYDIVIDTEKLTAEEQCWVYRKLQDIDRYIDGWDEAADGVFGYQFDEWDSNEDPKWLFVKLV